jgi:hypothetical protein
MRRAFSLLPALLCTCTLAAAPLTPALDDPRAVAALRDMGVALTFDDYASGRPAVAAGVSDAVADVTAALALLDKLSHLREITFSGVSLLESDVEHLKKLKQLRTLKLMRTVATDKDLQALATLTELRTLDLTSTELTTKAQQQLKVLTPLRELKLGVTTVIGDSGLAALSNLDRLEKLEIVNGDDITDAGLPALAGLKSLRHLSLSAPKVTSAGLAVLKDVDNLESLTLYLPTGEPLIGLKDVKKLRKLAVHPYSGAMQQDDPRLEGLKELVQLEELGVYNSRTTDADMDAIVNLTNLRRLTLQSLGGRTGSASFTRLKTLTNLQELTLPLSRRTGGLSADALGELREALPKLRIKTESIANPGGPRGMNSGFGPNGPGGRGRGRGTTPP